jgi:hypothetical protein
MNVPPNNSLALSAAGAMAAANLSISGPDTALLRLVYEFDSLTGFRMASFDAIQDDNKRTSYIAALDARPKEIREALWEHKPKTMDGFKAVAKAICNDNPEILGGDHLENAGQFDATLLTVLLHALAA